MTGHERCIQLLTSLQDSTPGQEQRRRPQKPLPSLQIEMNGSIVGCLNTKSTQFSWFLPEARKARRFMAAVSQLATSATVKRLCGVAWAYCSTAKHSKSCTYSPQVSPQQTVPAQNAGQSACWGNQMQKRLAAGTPGDCRCGCCCDPRWNGNLGGKKQGALDPARGSRPFFFFCKYSVLTALCKRNGSFRVLVIWG